MAFVPLRLAMNPKVVVALTPSARSRLVADRHGGPGLRDQTTHSWVIT
jgi:hypothetical protein